MANMGSWRLNLEDNRTEWSDQVYAIHGLPVGQSTDLHGGMTFFPPRARAEIGAGLARTIETGEPFSIEADFITAQGDLRRVRSMGELEIRDGRPLGVIGVIQDITNRYHLEQALRKTAHVDALTGLASRARFNEVVDEMFANARINDEPLAFALIDLDNFKMVNDLCGHQAGDDLLRTMAARMQADYLQSCLFARLGGDEFVMIVTDPALIAGLESLILRMAQDLCDMISGGGVDIAVSATIGAAVLDADVQDSGDLLHRADIALYEAKRHRRGSVRVYRDAMVVAQTGNY